MASLLGNSTSRFGDSLISHVLPRIPFSHHQTGSTRGSIRSDASSFIPPTPYQGPQVATTALLSLIDTRASVPPIATVNSIQDPIQTKPKGKRKLSDYYRTPVRRQQCRANQARYRNRQREYHVQLEQNVVQLRQEVGSLKHKYRDMSSRERSNQSPWSIVADVFRLIESSFWSPWRTVNKQEMQNHKETRQILAVLERSFAHDVALGEVSGVKALLEQLRRFSQYFADPQLKLLRVESVTSGVMAARAKLSVTVSKLSLEHIFVSDEHEPLRITHNRLLGQRLELSCMINFLFDEESCRVVRLESQINLVTGLLRVLGNLQDVAEVLEHALITPECTIDDSSL